MGCINPKYITPAEFEELQTAEQDRLLKAASHIDNAYDLLTQALMLCRKLERLSKGLMDAELVHQLDAALNQCAHAGEALMNAAEIRPAIHVERTQQELREELGLTKIVPKL